MTEAEAEMRLEKMTQHNVEPKLDTQEIGLLLEIFRRTDSAGNAPTSDDWQPNYDLSRAAAEGWRWKAAKASELVSVDLDGERMSSNQVFEHCQRMAQMYSRKRIFSLGTTTQ